MAFFKGFLGLIGSGGSQSTGLTIKLSPVGIVLGADARF